MTIATTTKKCLICNKGRRNDVLYWHVDPDTNNIWAWCNKCDRGYSIYEYCTRAGISLTEFLKLDFDFREAKSSEVQKMDWPKSFIPLYDRRAAEGLKYLESRGIRPDDNMFYDTWRKGIVFPYYYDNVFCGAQIRFIEPKTDEDGDVRKIDTMPGTRLGLLFYNWNQVTLPPHIKGVVVCEGAFNALAISQSLSEVYGGVLQNPWRCIACSGSGASEHHIETIQSLRDEGKRVVLAPDSDRAGIKMFRKFTAADAITHFVFTNNEKIDWNDAVLAMGRLDFAKWFLGSIQDVRRKTESSCDDKASSAEQQEA